MKQTIIAFVLALTAATAFATDYTVNTAGVQGAANISNTVSTSAAANGVGSSTSFAAGDQKAGFTGSATSTGLTGTIAGTTMTEGSATAWNVSTGTGTGAASSIGLANASLDACARFQNASASGNIVGSAQSHSTNNAVAGTNQGITNISGNASTFTGSTVATVDRATGTVTGTVKDAKTNLSYAASGLVNTPTGTLAAGTGSATANGNVTVVGNVTARLGNVCVTCR